MIGEGNESCSLFLEARAVCLLVGSVSSFDLRIFAINCTTEHSTQVGELAYTVEINMKPPLLSSGIGPSCLLDISIYTVSR